MRKRLFKILPAAALALTSFVGVAAYAADSDVQMETYRLSDGSSRFLVPLRAEAVKSTSDYVDVAALVDFSAAQLDRKDRDAAQKAVAAMVANLPKNARVQLFVVSNETESLTDGYVAVGSAELAKAVASLSQRAPLGAADLAQAYGVAALSFDLSENADRNIVFFGRGVSTGAAFDEDVFEQTADSLVASKITASAYGVGSNVNYKTLGAMANRTGGVVALANSADEAGRELALATTASVFWPTENVAEIDGAEVYPNPLAPIRSDRDTYLVGSADEDLSDFALTIPVAVSDGREADIAWNVSVQEPSEANRYIYSLAQEAAADSGATLAVAGEAMLVNYQLSADEAADQLVELAEQANEAGDAEDAKRLANIVDVSLELQDDEAEDVAEAVVEEAAPVATKAADVDAEADRLFAIAQQNIKDNAKKGANLIEATEANVSLYTQQAKTRARVAVQDALKDSKSNPDGALTSLKLVITSFKNDPVLSAADREIILHDLEACAQNVAYEKEAKARRDYVAMQNQAVVDSERKASEVFRQRQAKVVEIMKRFDSLIREGQFVLASQAATEAAKQGVDSALGEQAANVALMRDAFTENQYLRYERRRRLLDVLMSVERAHVPVSDEPPICYPDAETWIKLSKERKDKYNATNLTGSEEEQRIAKALNVPVDVAGGEDSDLTLSDWIESVKQQLKNEGNAINIVFDISSIEEAGGDVPSAMIIRESLF
ncbi:MAG: hypothetical protein HUK22_01390, partial [Thermoguttaceae bacterium]|nr:hypothetical protein [Thermoguttaceae bacterium]